MTDRLKGLLITFDRDIRTDDAEELLATLKYIVGVADAKAIIEPLVTSYDDHMARARVRSDIGQQLIDKIIELTDPDLYRIRMEARKRT